MENWLVWVKKNPHKFVRSVVNRENIYLLLVSEKWDVLEQPCLRETCGFGERKNERVGAEEALVAG